MDKLSVMILGLVALFAVCSSYPRWKPAGSQYWMKQQRQPVPSRRPANIRSRLSLPVKPNTNVRHHVSVQNVPGPDSHIGIIKQTVIVKTPTSNRRTPKPGKPNRKASPRLHGSRPVYRTTPPINTNTQYGQGLTGAGGRGHGRNNNGPNNRNNGPNNRNNGPNNRNNGPNNRNNGQNNRNNGQNNRNNGPNNRNNGPNNKNNGPNNRNNGPNNKNNGPNNRNNGPNNRNNGPNNRHHNPSLLPAISKLNEHLGSLIDVLRSNTANGGLPPTTMHPLDLGTSIPTIVIVDNTGSGRNHGSPTGSGRMGSGQHSGMMGISRNSLRHSLFNSNALPLRTGSSSFSSRKGSPNDILILQNGPNTKAIRISTKGGFGFTKTPKAVKGVSMTTDSKASQVLVNTTPSGEDPPEVGEAGEP